MTILVTGSAGHLGEAVMCVLRSSNCPALGIDIHSSAYTHRVGSITDRAFLRDIFRNNIRSVIRLSLAQTACCDAFAPGIARHQFDWNTCAS
ncbi:nucleoside-diphosphate-sugar epimerase [Nitrobacteraceae bacterium AZCC 2146]